MARLAVCSIKQIAHFNCRLDTEERRLLRLLEAALNVSEYTDKVRRLVPFCDPEVQDRSIEP